LLLGRHGLLPASLAPHGLAARGAQGLLDLAEHGLRKQADSGAAEARTPPTIAIDRKALSDFLMSDITDFLITRLVRVGGWAAAEARR